MYNFNKFIVDQQEDYNQALKRTLGMAENLHIGFGISFRKLKGVVQVIMLCIML